MIAHAGRYYPILRLLRSTISQNPSILEVGSGPNGLGEYYSHRFVGCDVTFSEPPKPPMLPVVASAVRLPFRNASFDAVVASDVLEHVPPDSRHDLICEALRVTRTMAVFGFPCGQRAYALDQGLFATYHELGTPAPPWLEEHMLYSFPDEGLFQHLDQEWTVRRMGNDNLHFHNWLLRRMMGGSRWMLFFHVMDKFAPRLMEHALRLADCEPCYRRIIALTRKRDRAAGRQLS